MDSGATEPDFFPLGEYGGGTRVEYDESEGEGERGSKGGPVDNDFSEGPEAGTPERKYFVRFGFVPMERWIMLSISPMVFFDTLTASPLIACTVESRFRVSSEVRNTSARGGREGTGSPLLAMGVLLAGVPE